MAVTPEERSRNRELKFTNPNIVFSVRKMLPNFATFEIPLSSALFITIVMRNSTALSEEI